MTARPAVPARRASAPRRPAATIVCETCGTTFRVEANRPVLLPRLRWAGAELLAVELGDDPSVWELFERLGEMFSGTVGQLFDAVAGVRA